MQSTNDFCTACEGDLIEGRSLNVVGLPGSGRTVALMALKDYLEKQGWSVLYWDISILRDLAKGQKQETIDGLRLTQGWPVLIIDDFGRHLVDGKGDGAWLDAFLFMKIHEAPADTYEYLRCVVVTSPRDMDITSTESGVRERCKILYAPLPPPPEELPFHINTFEDLLRFSGGNHLLVPQRTIGSAEDRGFALRRFKELAPSLVGYLSQNHQKRLNMHLQSPGRRKWEPDRDDCLFPLLIPMMGSLGLTCFVPSVVNVEELKDLLLPNPWPEYNIEASARRFASRCGNERNPIWIDNFLSDCSQLDFSKLAAYLKLILKYAPTINKIKLLSRNMVDRSAVKPADIASALSPYLTSELRERIEWRIYNFQEVGDLHDRQLLLPKRRSSFHLPIVRILLGMRPVGNEIDAEIAAYTNKVSTIYPNATRVAI